MHYATAIWNYADGQTPLAELVEEFADFGYDTISVSPAYLEGLPVTEVEAAASVIDYRDLAVTIHANFDVSIAQLGQWTYLFGVRILCITFDVAMTSDSTGYFYDTARMAPFLDELLRITDGSDIRIGLEDFPLDSAALDCYASDLQSLAEHPRYGILIDVGHMNIRLTGEPYFSDLTIQDYFRGIPVPLIEVHLHDNDGQRDQHGYFGMGNVAFDEVAAALKAMDFEGVSTVEIAPGFHGADPARTKHRARQALQLWRQLWEG